MPVRKLHGLPGTGPNQTLEEFRPAVTTSPETRRSGDRPAAAAINETSGDSVRDAAPRRRNVVGKLRAAVVRTASFQRRPVAPLRPAIDARRGATCIGSGRPPPRMERLHEARPARNRSTSSRAQLCSNLGRRRATLARGSAAAGRQSCATSAQAYRAAVRALAHVHRHRRTRRPEV
ncbi:hypothetical protein F511_23472 [Dorcoceras hygrometricum]|uniref:Uncharacterized protein n=1 Tax=Dorcoceras hygrometricum TaxID=472368 RepID=A0A2Z7B7M5_9LAMI|nr:hypothetical protein F511_23472 [Dorcoceras hygrometricum]